MAKHKLLVKLLHPSAKLLSKAHPDEDAGFDIYAIKDVTVKAFEVATVPTGIAFTSPKGYYGQIKTRSSMGKQGMRVHPGVIDRGYTGEVAIIVTNLTSRDYEVHAGERVAQLLILPVPDMEVEEVKELPSSSRGTGGLGSTGR